MIDSLLNYRLRAAESSAGISGESIYRMAHAAIHQYGLHGDLLEYGAGTGSLILRLEKERLFSTITGADILGRPEALPAEMTWLQADLNEPLPCGHGSYDTIVSTEVIEHLENPRAAFREFHRLLRPGGTLIVTTPNQESLRSLLCFAVHGHFAAFRDASYPAHITALLSTDFIRICSETGFDPPIFLYSDSGGLPGFPQFLWQRVSAAICRGKWFSDNFGLVARRSLEMATPSAGQSLSAPPS